MRLSTEHHPLIVKADTDCLYGRTVELFTEHFGGIDLVMRPIEAERLAKALFAMAKEARRGK